MIQRIQTLYMLLAFLLVGVLPFFIPLWNTAEGPFYFMQDITYTAMVGLNVSLLLVSILFYKKRQHQFVLNRLNMIIMLILLGLFVYRSLNVSGGTAAVSEKGIGIYLPIISIVLLALANKAIKKDEELVKSVDRLR
jgi:energy-coupling factor transporter transmembrane protein EcfT